MAELKTKKTDASVLEFLNAVEHDKRRTDGLALLELMRDVTAEEPAMWGPSIVGFGSYQYEYASGRTGEWPVVGFSPRKRSLTVYITPGLEQYEPLLEKLGKYRTGKGCLYINKLEDVDEQVLRELIRQSVAHVRESGR
jgi:hypothetical protein